MAVSARFKVGRVTRFSPTDEKEFDAAVAAGGDVSAEVEMVPDYAQGKNADWSKYTPSGVFRMTITNPAALEQLAQGKSLAILISDADE